MRGGGKGIRERGRGGEGGRSEGYKHATVP